MPKVLNFKHVKRISKDDVYIGRKMPNIPANDKFQNPFKMKNESERDLVVAQFREFLWKQIKMGIITKQDLLELDGKNLVCWCAPRACHGDVLLRAIKWAKSQLQ